VDAVEGRRSFRLLSGFHGSSSWASASQLVARPGARRTTIRGDIRTITGDYNCQASSADTLLTGTQIWQLESSESSFFRVNTWGRPLRTASRRIMTAAGRISAILFQQRNAASSGCCGHGRYLVGDSLANSRFLLAMNRNSGSQERPSYTQRMCCPAVALCPPAWRHKQTVVNVVRIHWTMGGDAIGFDAASSELNTR
jgi:hypothetical protein